MMLTRFYINLNKHNSVIFLQTLRLLRLELAIYVIQQIKLRFFKSLQTYYLYLAKNKKST